MCLIWILVQVFITSFKILFCFVLIVCMCVRVWECECGCPLDLELHAAMKHQTWVLGTELGASTRSICTLKYSVISLTSTSMIILSTLVVTESERKTIMATVFRGILLNHRYHDQNAAHAQFYQSAGRALPLNLTKYYELFIYGEYFRPSWNHLGQCGKKMVLKICLRSYLIQLNS